MKKLLAILLSLALIFTFAACGVEDSDDDKKGKDKTAASAGGDEDGGQLDDDTASDEDEDEDKDEDNSSSEGNGWDDDYYNNIVLHWPDALDINDYTNFTITLDVKSEQLGDSTQILAFNNETVTISSDTTDAETTSDAESVAGDLWHHPAVYCLDWWCCSAADSAGIAQGITQIIENLV